MARDGIGDRCQSRDTYVTGTGIDGTLVERDLLNGTERTILPSGLLKAQIAYRADGRTLLIIGAQPSATRASLFQVTANGELTTLISGDSTIADLQVVSGGRQLVYGIGGRS